jgi:hypothetical protein
MMAVSVTQAFIDRRKLSKRVKKTHAYHQRDLYLRGEELTLLTLSIKTI